MTDRSVERFPSSSGSELAIIVRAGFDEPGLTFFTPDDYGQQLGFMHHAAGHVVQAHVHHAVERVVTTTMEALFVRSGRVRVDLFEESRDHVATRILGPGDVILLVSGGHRFEMLEASEMIEVKQGPFAGAADKSRFDPTVPPLAEQG